MDQVWCIVLVIVGAVMAAIGLLLGAYWEGLLRFLGLIVLLLGSFILGFGSSELIHSGETVNLSNS